MVKILSAITSGLLLLLQASSTLALPTGQAAVEEKQLNKRAYGKRSLAWDWTNTANPAFAAKINNVPFDRNLMTAVHNWNTWYPSELNGRAAFHPMVRTRDQTTGSEWSNLINAITARGSRIVHFFNEPERNGMSAAEAASIWFNVMIPLKNQYGLKLVGPAVASDNTGTAWLDDFMNRISSARPDYLGIHYYGTSSAEAIGYLQFMYQRYGGLPLYITEIASISRNSDEVFRFTIDVTNWMDNTSWIFMYAWFGAMTAPPDSFVSPAAMLMNSDGSFRNLFNKLLYDLPLFCNMEGNICT